MVDVLLDNILTTNTGNIINIPNITDTLVTETSNQILNFNIM